MLAIFSHETDGEVSACERALSAARVARQDLTKQNRRRTAAGLDPFEIGIALHVGELLFGNVGAPGRLDFTVIGPAVNEAARIEGLCRALARPVIASAEFAAGCPAGSVTSLGRHKFRGVAGECEVVTPVA